MAYNYPPAGLAPSLFGVPYVINAPTSYVAEIQGTRFVMEVQASGISPGHVLVPVPSALTANGIVANVSGLAWGNTGMAYAGVYAKSAAGLFAAIRPPAGGWQLLHANAGWTGEVSVYSQASQNANSNSMKIRVVGPNIFYDSGTNDHAMSSEALIAFLLDVAEYGLILSTGTGYWGRAEFDLIQAA